MTQDYPSIRILRWVASDPSGKSWQEFVDINRRKHWAISKANHKAFRHLYSEDFIDATKDDIYTISQRGSTQLACEPGERTVALYRYWSETGTLLYVGQTLDIKRRNSQHMRKAPWYWESTQWPTYEWFKAGDIDAVEREAIVSERPLHNVVHNV